MSGYDAVIGEDSTTFYSFDAYRDAVEKAKNAGSYLSFADYLAAGNAETTANRPYAVKYVLEDNLLGETQMNGNYLGKEAPAIHLTDETGNTITEIKEGTDVYLSCEDLANYSLNYSFANSWKQQRNTAVQSMRLAACSFLLYSFLRMLYAIPDSFPCRIPFPLSLQMRSPAMLSCRA